jgi:SAM-dependent methyltransferase
MRFWAFEAMGGKMLKPHQEGYGQALYDFFHKAEGYEIVERDDGLIAPAGGPQNYFRSYDEWPESQKQAMSYVRGRVLDIGCGAGRHSLYLQEQGFDPLGIDISPLAIEVCKLRGLEKAKVLSITQVSSKLGTFDTILMLGNNFGLFGSFKRARWLLRRFRAMTSAQARIIAESRDPLGTDRPEHLAYHEFNRQRGRMPGQLRIRVRYRTYTTPWFDYLLVSQVEMQEILAGTGWAVREFLDWKEGIYTAIVEKEPTTS